MYRHRFDPLSAIFGAVFVFIGLPVLIGDVNLFEIRWSWAAPILAILAGGALLLSGMRRPAAEADDA